MTNEELRDEILTRDPQEFEEMIETVIDGIFDQYSDNELAVIKEAFNVNLIDTTGICKSKRPN